MIMLQFVFSIVDLFGIPMLFCLHTQYLNANGFLIIHFSEVFSFEQSGHGTYFWI